jgi:steroid 5-alpha reductase family enzyme
MMSFWPQLLTVALAASALMTLLWLVQRRTRDAGVVDAGWAGGLAAAAIFAGATGSGHVGVRLLIALMGGLWGLRLCWHILSDRVLKGAEDGRYAMWREKLGPRVNRAFFWFFQAQAFFVVFLCVPFLLAAGTTQAGPLPGGLTWMHAAGAILFITSKAGELIADQQLKAFKAKAENKGRTCRSGLWRFSRHPNYFCEWLIWVSFALVATGSVSGAGVRWLAWLAPTFMLFLILKVTGIPPTEKRALATRGEDYRRYQRETSAFVPWFPKPAANGG